MDLFATNNLTKQNSTFYEEVLEKDSYNVSMIDELFNKKKIRFTKSSQRVSDFMTVGNGMTTLTGNDPATSRGNLFDSPGDESSNIEK
jgi:hypothetical protein